MSDAESLGFRPRLCLLLRAAAFALGLASTLALLGVISTYVGRAYGQIGSGLPIGARLTLTP